MSAKRKVWAKHLPAAVAVGAGLGVLGPLALLAVPGIVLWWRKAAKDAVSADLEDEMESDGVREALRSANQEDLDALRGAGCSSNEVGRSETRSRKHPVFGVKGHYTISESSTDDE